MYNNTTGGKMTLFEPSRLGSGNMLDLSVKSIILISFLSLNELIFMMTGLTRTVSVLLIIPAVFMIVHYWPHFWKNEIVLLFIVPVAVYVLLATMYGTFSGNVDFSLIPAILLSSALAVSISIHIISSDEKTIGNLVEFTRNILFLASTAIVLSPLYYPYVPELQPSHTNAHRFSGFFKNPNDASLMAVVFLNFVLYRPFDRKILTALAMTIAIFAVYHTLSKTGIIMFAASFLIYFSFNRKWWFFLILSVFLLYVMYSLGILSRMNFILPMTPERLYRIERMIDFFDGHFTPDNTGDKDVLWYDAVQRIQHAFPHGAGLGTFHRLVDSKFQWSILDDWYGVHNMYLMIFGEAGLVAFAVFVGCYGRLAILSLFSSRDQFPFAVIMVSLLFFGTSHHAFEIRSQMVALAIVIGLLGRNIMNSVKYPSREC